MQTKRRIVSLALALLMLPVLAACGPQTVEGEKTVTFTVVDANKAEQVFTIETDAEYLADALLEKGIIAAKAADGYYTTINGITADYSADQSWWCITQNGEMTNYGLNDLAIKDGDSFEATYTVG